MVGNGCGPAVLTTKEAALNSKFHRSRQSKHCSIESGQCVSSAEISRRRCSPSADAPSSGIQCCARSLYLLVASPARSTISFHKGISRSIRACSSSGLSYFTRNPAFQPAQAASAMFQSPHSGCQPLPSLAHRADRTSVPHLSAPMSSVHQI